MNSRQITITQTLENISFILIEYRKIFGVTQKSLSHKLGIPSGHLSKLENKKLCPSVALWSYICAQLEIPLGLLNIPPDLIRLELGRLKKI